MRDFSSSHGKHMNCILRSCRALRKFRKPGQDMLHTWAGAIMGCSRRYVRQNCEVFELQVSRIQQISSPPLQPLSRCSGWNSVDTGQCTALHCICAGGKRSYGVKVEVDITVTTLRSSHPISPKLQFQCQAKSWWPIFPGNFMSGGSRSQPKRKGSGPGKSQIDINLILVVLTRVGRGPWWEQQRGKVQPCPSSLPPGTCPACQLCPCRGAPMQQQLKNI